MRIVPGITADEAMEAVDTSGGVECMRRLAERGAGLDADGKAVQMAAAIDVEKLLKGPELPTAAGILGGVLAFGG